MEAEAEVEAHPAVGQVLASTPTLTATLVAAAASFFAADSCRATWPRRTACSLAAAAASSSAFTTPASAHQRLGASAGPGQTARAASAALPSSLPHQRARRS